MWDSIAKPEQYADSKIDQFFEVGGCSSAAVGHASRSRFVHFRMGVAIATNKHLVGGKQGTILCWIADSFSSQQRQFRGKSWVFM